MANAMLESRAADRKRQQLVDEGRDSLTRHQKPCDLVLSFITGKDEDSAGMVFATLRGFGNRPEGQAQNLSSFRLRVAYPGLQSVYGTTKDLWYGNVLDKEWIDLSIGKSWIQECLNKHKECTLPSWSAAMQDLEFLRVIDVDQMCLVEIKDPSRCRFVALSYKWGNTNSCLLQADNIHGLSQPGTFYSIMNELPRTIADSLAVVKSLGERYLWVDSLCIQQDAGDDKARQIAAMDRVYGTALMTIVAASGEHADAGLRGVNPSGFYHTNSKLRRGPRNLSQSSVKIDQEGLYLIAPFENTQDISKSPWGSRAWTFQEKVLSRRMLIFCGEEAVWHCRGMICREDMMNDDAENRCSPLDWLRLDPQHFHPFQGPDPHWVDGSFVRDKNGRTHLVRSSAFREYARMIQAFSSRRLTYKADVIRALQGLLNILSRALLSEFQYGLPESLFDVSLLWTPKEPLTRRCVSEIFPSWSWAGWEGVVKYENCFTITRDDYGKAIKVEMSELRDEGIRPLISWYVLDKAGTGLRRLDSVLAMFTETPPEWEAKFHGLPKHTQRELEAGILAELDHVKLLRHHLIFQTSCANCSVFTGEPCLTGAGLSIHATNGSRIDGSPISTAIKDAGEQNVGHLILDSELPTQESLLLVLIAESQPFQLGLQCEDAEEYSCYVVMLLQRATDSDTFERFGVGKVWKTAWKVAQPFRKTIVLG